MSYSGGWGLPTDEQAETGVGVAGAGGGQCSERGSRLKARPGSLPLAGSLLLWEQGCFHFRDTVGRLSFSS